MLTSSLLNISIYRRPKHVHNVLNNLFDKIIPMMRHGRRSLAGAQPKRDDFLTPYLRCLSCLASSCLCSESGDTGSRMFVSYSDVPGCGRQWESNSNPIAALSWITQAARRTCTWVLSCCCKNRALKYFSIESCTRSCDRSRPVNPHVWA